MKLVARGKKIITQLTDPALPFHQSDELVSSSSLTGTGEPSPRRLRELSETNEVAA